MITYNDCPRCSLPVTNVDNVKPHSGGGEHRLHRECAEMAILYTQCCLMCKEPMDCFTWQEKTMVESIKDETISHALLGLSQIVMFAVGAILAIGGNSLMHASGLDVQKRPVEIATEMGKFTLGYIAILIVLGLAKAIEGRKVAHLRL